MKIAIQQAKESFNNDEVPVGAVIVDTQSGEVIAKSYNNVECDFDPTAHAEINVIRQAGKIKKTNKLVDCDMYVTLEPCPMCAAAISFARIRRLYFGVYDVKSGGVEHGPRVLQSKSCHHKPEIYGGISEDVCKKLMQSFFIKKR